MGKILVIKNTDFSGVAVSTITPPASDEMDTLARVKQALETNFILNYALKSPQSSADSSDITPIGIGNIQKYPITYSNVRAIVDKTDISNLGAHSIIIEPTESYKIAVIYGTTSETHSEWAYTEYPNAITIDTTTDNLCAIMFANKESKGHPDKDNENNLTISNVLFDMINVYIE